jgi:hypothetical protein
MFEGFTGRALRVVVLAQEEARMLGHNYIGTEHLLLGLIHEGDGVAARALESLGDQPGRGPAAGRGDHRPGRSGPVRGYPVHAPGQEGARASAARVAAARPRFHRHRAHPARPHPRGRQRGRAGAGQAGRGDEPGAPAGHRAHLQPVSAAGSSAAPRWRTGARGAGSPGRGRGPAGGRPARLAATGRDRLGVRPLGRDRRPGPGRAHQAGQLHRRRARGDRGLHGLGDPGPGARSAAGPAAAACTATSRINQLRKGYLFESPVMAGLVCAACTAFMPGSNWRTCAR